jgi:hypothetical protein
MRPGWLLLARIISLRIVARSTTSLQSTSGLATKMGKLGHLMTEHHFRDEE